LKKLDKKLVQHILKPRTTSASKADFGHAYLVAGNTGKMGAAIIAAKACMRAGVGLLTVNVPNQERDVLHISLPEAMISIREKKENNFKHIAAMGIGPGIGFGNESAQLVNYVLLQFNKPLLLDADALNIISAKKEWLDILPKQTIITPHAKEFDRLFGMHVTNKERIKTAIQKSKQYKIIIVLKGNNTLITFNGKSYQNTTGNVGLAKAGSGDALSGIITAFLAQGYSPFDAAKLGVYMHGLAADICLQYQSVESMLITDVIQYLGEAFKTFL
jgi:NAD(P)H-hydrate epimerase